MSFHVLVIPEDPTHNGSILKPLCERILASCGKANAYVQVLTNPKLGGKDQMGSRLPEILDKYHHLELMLAFRDCDGENLSASFASWEKQAAQAGVTLLCCGAVQETEIYCLAGFHKELERPWNEVRQEVSLKETVFASFSQLRYSKYPDGGRREMVQRSLENYDGLLARCPELAKLEERIKKAL